MGGTFLGQKSDIIIVHLREVHIREWWPVKSSTVGIQMLDMSCIQMVKQSQMVELFGHPIPFETVQKLDILSGLQMVLPFEYQ